MHHIITAGPSPELFAFIRDHLIRLCGATVCNH